MHFTHVDKPLTINGLTLRNRIFRSAHATGLAFAGIGDDFIEYHAARARGGVALSFLEILSVHPSSPGMSPIYSTPGAGDGYRRLVDAIAPHGMALFQQLWHGGHNSVIYDGRATWSASDIPSPYWGGSPPIPMTQAMIDEVIGGFAAAARSLEQWGIQGAEVHAGHNYLVQQFLQSTTNRREDNYGGPLENRARFLIEILEAIRAAVSPKFVLGIRIGEGLSGGPSDAEELAAVVRMLEARGLIDFINATHAGYYALYQNTAGMDRTFGYQLVHNAPIRRAASVPVLVIGNFRTMEEADQVIRAGEADMVGMTRATIADPDLVSNSLAGKIEQVRPCIGCMQDCMGGLMTAHRLGCVVNPAVSFEARLSEDRIPAAASRRRVVVVGGGPAGMEAARIAALRGHQTILFEAESKLGGAVKLAARAPNHAAVADITIWLEAEIYRLGVDVRLNSYADADDIAAEKPDAVIVATGSTPRLDGVLASCPGEPIRGMDHRSVRSGNDVIGSLPPAAGTRVIVIDDIGHYEPIAVAEYLVAHGVEVTMVTRHISFAPYLENTFQNEAHLRRISKRGLFALRTRTRAIRISDDGVSVIPTYHAEGADDGETLAADLVVVVTANAPNRELHLALLDRGIGSQLAGDALSPRFMGAAIRDGRNIGMAI